MVIIRIMGGLGNQMFQYAYAKTLQQKGYNVKLDIYDLYYKQGIRNYELNYYDIKIPCATEKEINKYGNPILITRIFNKIKFILKIPISNPRYIEETSLKFDKSLLSPPEKSYIVGYFQNENYFRKIKSFILDDFTLKTEFSKYSKDINKKILESQYSCSLHIRRGDYLKEENLDLHGLCSLEYYNQAIDTIKAINKNVTFFIFSDDIDWAKENLKIENAIYVHSKEQRIPHEDIFLMSECDHNIIANSSFSWWGAYLNKNENKIVIAPKRWFVDKTLNSDNIACKNWIKI